MRTHVFGPEDELPAWAIAKILNPKVWDEAPVEVPVEAPVEVEVPVEAPPVKKPVQRRTRKTANAGE
ncbi:hypothetical protein PXH69_24190 [Rhodococcus qingshengii]|uniref:Uncharacterized protein n=1 Tax=Rhodococcus qingshengii TaxID=334542 RepID=A0AAW6LUI2_RHOSG|nr:hypothetical protein [Rhodococcus qingshengii]MDE8648083.1 hypothetical protein [Rhodococcus qingshengii]